jgi:hypothetical protein
MRTLHTIALCSYAFLVYEVYGFDQEPGARDEHLRSY